MGNIMLSDDNKCPICGKLGAEINTNGINDPLYHYNCENCGCFFVPDPHRTSDLGTRLVDKFNVQHLKSYLFYHPSELRPIICDSDYFNKHVTEEFVRIYNLTPEMVESWYPKNFAEKIDKILLYFDSKTKFIGEKVYYDRITLKNIYFIDAFNLKREDFIYDKHLSQINYYNYFLKKNDFLTVYEPNLMYQKYWKHEVEIQLNPKGLARIDELQKNQINNKNVFVAMKFGEETKELRERIKEGLKGFSVRIMDEIEHNHQIVPEMLYEIRNSRFVIAELSHHNNGAYYEAGYALGLGKEVIHICDKKELKSGLHFDVAQVNTIFYDSIDEIPEKLRKRIQATIK